MSSSNALAINVNTGNSLQRTLETLLQKFQNQPGSPPSGSYASREQDYLYFRALADKKLNGVWQIPSVEESESFDLENKELESAGY